VPPLRRLGHRPQPELAGREPLVRTTDDFTWYYDKPLPYYLTPQGESALDGPDPGSARSPES
jgi:hypothetical protein